MVEEGEKRSPTARSKPWNDVMVGWLVGVRGSGCHSVDLVSLVAVLRDMASDMNIGMDTLTADFPHTT